MKRSIFRTAAALFCAVACVCGFAACAKGEQKKAAESITLSKTELALEIGGEETLTATVTPEDASEKNSNMVRFPCRDRYGIRRKSYCRCGKFGDRYGNGRR